MGTFLDYMTKAFVYTAMGILSLFSVGVVIAFVAVFFKVTVPFIGLASLVGLFLYKNDRGKWPWEGRGRRI